MHALATAEAKPFSCSQHVLGSSTAFSLHCKTKTLSEVIIICKIKPGSGLGMRLDQFYCLLYLMCCTLTKCCTCARHCTKGIVISTSHLLSEFQVSEHITCMDRKFCEWINWLRTQNTLYSNYFSTQTKSRP